jgi:hypothetical protein
MARNLINDPTVHLSEACGIHVGDDLSTTDPIPAVDHRGVCMVSRGVVKTITQTGSLIRMQVIEKVLTNNCEIETCRSYTIGGRLFDSLYPVECEDLPVLVSHRELMDALRMM